MRPIHGPPVVALALFATFLAVTIAQAKPGDLDPSFGGDGKVVNRFCTHPRDGQVVIDHSTPHGAAVDSATVNLTAGKKYAIRIDYTEHTGEAYLKLLWSNPNRRQRIIPTSQLFAS